MDLAVLHSFIQRQRLDIWGESETLEKSTCEYGVSSVELVVFVFLPICPSPGVGPSEGPREKSQEKQSPPSLIPCNSALCSHWKIPV
ncbi:hypothetical protein VN97_g8861 [Penicillium thymicola]|uniref:Uncharacterized protein n=1 Tax=Penicillium thymicola TaxID=293382 RepID=A0AAI9TBZ1_PENTH|nr:hypothetical protein VN97_g8861 [Penicillium thymicola]